MPRPADLVITDVDVLTPGGWRTGVAVAEGRITAVTDDDEELRSHVGPHTQVVPMVGRTVLPGFQDAHIHAPFAGRNRLHVWLNDTQSVPEYLRRVREFADANPDHEWIIGGGWSMASFPGGNPRREDLDAAVPDRPVFLFNRDVHGAWVNSRALEVAGITAATPDPADGRYERDPDGSPTGSLHEGAAYSFNGRVVPLPQRSDWEAAIVTAQSYLHSLGITAWQDAWVTPGTHDAYRSLAQSGRLSARVVGALWWDRHRELDQIPEFLAHREQAVGNYRPTTVKIMTDGVIENHTGALLQPYCDGCGGHTNNSGLAHVDRDLLQAAVVGLDRIGFQVHMHAIGDRAVRNALDAVQAARVANGPNDLRHHIAHVQVVQPEDIGRFGQLGVVANCQPYWAHMEPQMAELTIPFLGRDRADLQYPFADFLRADTVLAGGSDWSVTTADPLAEIEVMATRVDPAKRDNAPYLPEQRVTPLEAIAAFTSGSAFVNHDDHDSGTIEVGKRADLAVLDRNVLLGPANEIADAKVVATFVSGTAVFGG